MCQFDKNIKFGNRKFWQSYGETVILIYFVGMQWCMTPMEGALVTSIKIIYAFILFSEVSLLGIQLKNAVVEYEMTYVQDYSLWHFLSQKKIEINPIGLRLVERTVVHSYNVILCSYKKRMRKVFIHSCSLRTRI